jgi:GT2 family glycosyltransferase
MTDNPTKRIYCIVPTHGAGDAFVDCIESLLHQTVKPDQIIIVNNNVKDGSITRLLEKHGAPSAAPVINGVPVRILKLASNTGVTGGRNAGIAALPAEYDYALFVDHDMIARESLLAELLWTAEKREQIGIVTPKVYYWEMRNVIWSAGSDIDRKTGRTIFHGGEDLGQFEEEREVAIAPATFLVKKPVLDAVRRFDERYFATYEDTDFCFAAREKGFLTYYCPKAVTYHKIPYDPELAMKRLLDRTYWVARNRYLFMRKFKLFGLASVAYIPVYVAYYTMLAVRHRRWKAIPEYLRGLYAGLTESI